MLTITLTGRGKLCSALRLAPLPYIGTISYTMYLIHETAIILSRRASANRWLAASLALTMTIAWAATSWTLLERRMLVRHQ